MAMFLRFIHSRMVNISINILLSSVYFLFASRHVIKFEATHEWMYLLFCFAEALQVSFFLFRSLPKRVSQNPIDWLAAIAGTFLPLLMTPADWGLLPQAGDFIFFGISLQLVGLISLNRSFAIVAAERIIKTQGLYRFVRHPMYASYFITFPAYVLANTTVANVGLCLLTLSFLLIRMVQEERLLSETEQYRSYMKMVPFRLVPYVF